MHSFTLTSAIYKPLQLSYLPLNSSYIYLISSLSTSTIMPKACLSHTRKAIFVIMKRSLTLTVYYIPNIYSAVYAEHITFRFNSYLQRRSLQIFFLLASFHTLLFFITQFSCRGSIAFLTDSSVICQIRPYM